MSLALSPGVGRMGVGGKHAYRSFGEPLKADSGSLNLEKKTQRATFLVSAEVIPKRFKDLNVEFQDIKNLFGFVVNK